MILFDPKGKDKGISFVVLIVICSSLWNFRGIWTEQNDSSQTQTSTQKTQRYEDRNREFSDYPTWTFSELSERYDYAMKSKRETVECYFPSNTKYVYDRYKLGQGLVIEGKISTGHELVECKVVATYK